MRIGDTLKWADAGDAAVKGSRMFAGVDINLWLPEGNAVRKYASRVAHTQILSAGISISRDCPREVTNDGFSIIEAKKLKTT